LEEEGVQTWDGATGTGGGRGSEASFGIGGGGRPSINLSKSPIKFILFGHLQKRFPLAAIRKA
jgi:hypothetical protein